MGVFFDYEDERQGFASLKARWRHGSHASLSGGLRVERRSSEAFESEGDAARWSVAASIAPTERWSCDASFVYQTYDFDAETSLLFLYPTQGTILVPRVVSFDGVQRVLTVGTRFRALEACEPTADISLAQGTGDGAFDYLTARLDLPVRVASGLELGLETSFYEFDGEDVLDSSDYDATVALVYVRYRF